MKVDGWLERAQLENIASVNPSPTATGRVYLDTTDPLNGLMKFYNGSQWKNVLTGAVASLITQNSGKAVTVNWASGLIQQVVLTDHCVISFSNPQTGMVHQLLVTQRATEAAGTTPYMYRFNMPDQDTRRTPYQPWNVLQSSENQNHSWVYKAALKAAYATVPAAYGNPAALPATLMTGIDVFPGQGRGYIPGGSIIVGGRTSTPFTNSLRFYDAGAKFLWGTLNVTAPTAAAAQVVALNYAPNGQVLFTAGGTTPFLQGWNTDIYGVPNNGVWANPGTLPTGAGQCVAVHPSGSHVVIGHTTTPFMSAYPINSGAYGTKVTNPGSLPAAQVNAVAWSPCGEFLAVASQTSPFLEVYPFDPFVGFGTKVTAPGILPAGGPPGALGKALSWHPSGNFIAMGMNASPFVYIVPFNRATSAFGTAATISFVTGPTTTVNCLQFSPCGNYLAIGTTANMYIHDFSTGVIGSNNVVYDSTGPAVQVNDLVFHPSGELITAALNVSPFTVTYPMPRVAKGYLKVLE